MGVELKPHTVVWEYTLQCNSNCIHCGSDARQPRQDELTSEEALDLVNQIKDIGFKRIILSGGEPLLRDDWFETAKKIKESNIEIGILTNALAWDSTTSDRIASLEPFAVGFSVDGEEALHDYLRGHKGSHKKVFDAIRKVRDQTICVVTAVNTKNLKELKQIRNRIIIYEIDAWQLQMTSPAGRMAQHNDLVLSEDEYYQLGEFIVETRQRLPHVNVQAGDCMGYFGRLEKEIRDNEWQGCGAGISGLGLDSNGNIRGCLSIRMDRAVEGNIRQQSLKTIWEDKERFKYNRDFKIDDLKGECKGCDYGRQCRGGCSNQSTSFFGEFNHAPYCFLRYEKR